MGGPEIGPGDKEHGSPRKACGAFALWETVLGALRPPRVVFHGVKAPPPFPRRTRLTGALGNGRRETVAIRRSAKKGKKDPESPGPSFILHNLS